MPDMPEVVSKGAILKKLDAFSLKKREMQNLLAELDASPDPDVADIAARYGILGPDERLHLEVDWFQNWWPSAQPVRPIVAAGFRLAIREALALHLPLDCYWMCHTGHEDPAGGNGSTTRTDTDGPVEIAVCTSLSQVTVMIHTPEPGRSVLPYVPPTVPEPIKVVKRVAGSIVVRQPMHRPADVVVPAIP
jgi:hypothetical protein